MLLAMLLADFAKETSTLPQTDFGSALLKMLAALLILLTLLGLTVWILKRLIRYRLNKGVGEQAIQVIEKRMVSPKTMLYLVEVEGERLLFAESQLEVRQLKRKEHTASAVRSSSSSE